MRSLARLFSSSRRAPPMAASKRHCVSAWRSASVLRTWVWTVGPDACGEEKSRAKERIFSLRSAGQGWDPRRQRPELWRLFNTRLGPGESMRVFPLSNWTELDVWTYIRNENIPVVPLYFAKERPVVERDGALIVVDDGRMPLRPGETPRMMRVRFRTLGCYPLTGAIVSDADTLDAIIAEVAGAGHSERQGRMIDHDTASSMEKKKHEGYF
jgi:sulfate adenylyltransferase subunit 2